MIALLDEPPKFCPNCGHKNGWDEEGKAMWLSGNCFQCISCDIVTQRVDRVALVETGGKYGDLKEHVDRHGGIDMPRSGRKTYAGKGGTWTSPDDPDHPFYKEPK